MARAPGKLAAADKGADMAKDKPAIDHDLIRELAKLLDETGLSEIEYEHEGKRVRVARRGKTGKPPPRAVSATLEAAPTGPGAAANDRSKHPGVVTSPMVGTAYRGPEPSARPFVEIGTRVRIGETLLIIEAMKTMNHIPAPRAGTVIEILFGDGQPVEFGEPLMIIE
jgi:acetyl-CoA carboxylase biotin carboxyl carrier protein